MKTVIKPNKISLVYDIVMAMIVDIFLFILCYLFLTHFGYLFLYYPMLFLFITGFIFECFIKSNQLVTSEILFSQYLQRMYIKRGMLLKKEIEIPFTKIYAVVKKHNIIQGFFGITDIEFQTTAKSFLFRGVREEDWIKFSNMYEKSRG